MTSDPRVVVGFDIAHDHSVDAMVFAMLDKKSNSLKHLTKDAFGRVTFDTETFTTNYLENYPAFGYSEIETRAMELFRQGMGFENDGDLIQTKENNHMATKLRTPTETIARSDLQMAMSAIGYGDSDFLLDLIAVAQELNPGEQIKRINQLRRSDLGKYLIVHSGDSANSEGYVTDVNFDDISGGRERPRLVLDGRMVVVSNYDFVILADESPNGVADELPTVDL